MHYCQHIFFGNLATDYFSEKIFSLFKPSYATEYNDAGLLSVCCPEIESIATTTQNKDIVKIKKV
jgi:hypothetical protein